MCGVCRHEPCVPRCPNYVPPEADRFCEICGEGIYEGEECIENDKGECIHFECVQGIRSLLEWLGYDVKYLNE